VKVERLLNGVKRLANGMARGAALIVTDRRWGVTMSAAALGFGLFVGVAIGPGAAGTFATSPQQLIELPSLVADDEVEGEEEAVEAGESSPSPAVPSGSLVAGGESSSLEVLPPAAPLSSEASESPPPAEEPAPEPKPATGEETEVVETTELVGTVVHVNPAARSYTLAIKGGELVPVHAVKLPQPGRKVSIEGRQLANGTFAEEGARKREGQVEKGSFRGVVTFVDADPASPGYTVSGRGASLFVAVAPDPAGAVPPLPPLGSHVIAAVAIERPAILAQRGIEIEPGEPSTYLDLSGIYAGISTETGQLLLSADDTRASEADLSLVIPPAIDTSRLEAGESLLATAELAEDGTLTLAGLASDEQIEGADDPTDAQGDLRRVPIHK
jgi:hypothetical protein